MVPARNKKGVGGLMDRKNDFGGASGFTIAELLVVVAIVGVLVAISIPVFTGQMEKAREATDAANIRSAYAVVMSKVIVGEDGGIEKVPLKQKLDHWQSVFDFPAETVGEPTANGFANVYFKNNENHSVIEFTSSTGNISYHNQGLYDDTFYISDANVTTDTWNGVDKSKVKKIVFQSGSSFKDGSSAGFFNGLTYLEEIDMLNVDLVKTDYNTFANTPNLKKITLANLKDANGYDFPGTWYYDEACTQRVKKGNQTGYSRITMADNGKTLYRNVS